MYSVGINMEGLSKTTDIFPKYGAPTEIHLGTFRYEDAGLKNM
jgi:hypothetical protein